MPTGYTYGVAEGNIETLEDYAKECARAFLWQARDSNEKDLRKLVGNNSDYLQNRYKEAKEYLEILLQLDDDGWQRLYDKEMADEKKSHEKYTAEKKLKKSRYESMIRKVNAWVAPTSQHAELKKFMYEQLIQSMDADCAIYERAPSPDLNTWRSNALKYAMEDVKCSLERVEAQKKKSSEFINWVEQLLKSIEGK